DIRVPSRCRARVHEGEHTQRGPAVNPAAAFLCPSWGEQRNGVSAVLPNPRRVLRRERGERRVTTPAGGGTSLSPPPAGRGLPVLVAVDPLAGIRPAARDQSCQQGRDQPGRE